MQRRTLISSAAALSTQMSAMLSIPAWANSARTPVRGGVLRVAVAPEPTLLTSAFITTMNIGMLSSKLFDGLVSYDLNLQPVAALATAWQTSADGKTLRLTLRQGVRWHDGQPFSSADVAWTLQEVWKKLHPFGRAAFANVERVETPDPHTVVLRLSAPAPYILNYINSYGAQVLPRHLYQGQDVLTHPRNNAPVGTGPFMFKEWVKGSHVRLERNPHYWAGGQPYLDGIVFKFISDAAARTVALEAGEVDVALGSIVPLTNLNRFKDAQKYRLNLDDGRYLSTIFLLQFNVRRPYFQDKRVRQAFAHAIDKKALLRVVFLNYGRVATGPVPSSVVNYYSDQVRHYDYDVRRAQDLLDQAGLQPGADGKRLRIRLDFDGFGGPIGARAGEFIKQALARIGVELELRSGDTATYLRRIFTEQDYDLMVSSLHRLPDPTLGVQRLYWSENIRKGVPWTNGSGYANAELDRVMEAAAVEPDADRRRALIVQWQQIVQDELPLIELIEQTWVTVQSARLHKTRAQGDGLFASLADAWLDAGR
jgi:peptide/nickel transport system substrate-binding protein